jgi:hypothetical protein
MHKKFGYNTLAEWARAIKQRMKDMKTEIPGRCIT